jgi:hypothetical protein
MPLAATVNALPLLLIVPLIDEPSMERITTVFPLIV